jgi:hypothetical protein
MSELPSNIDELIKEGYTYLRVKNIPKELLNSSLPIHIISEKFEVPEFNLEPGKNPTFLLQKEGVYEYLVMNGFLLDLKEEQISVTDQWGTKNAMIYR